MNSFLFRTALGYDLHRLAPQEDGSIICGGIEIPCSFVIEGAHSDGDVLFHALTDAFLSLKGTDIGIEFPNTDAINKARPSIEFFLYAINQTKNIYCAGNIDILIICDAPKISPHASKIRENLSSILDLSVDLISLRGKTTENTRPLMIEAYVNVLFRKISGIEKI